MPPIVWHRDGLISVEGMIVAVYERKPDGSFDVYGYGDRWQQHRGLNVKPRYLANPYIRELVSHRNELSALEKRVVGWGSGAAQGTVTGRSK
jgi:hypothetical protein